MTAGNIYFVVNQQAYRNEIENDHRDDHSVAQTHPGQTFRAAVIFRDGLKRDAPPEIAVNLNVPVVPTTVSGIPPAFFVEQPKHFAQKIVAVPPLLAPKHAATKASSGTRALGQMFMLPDDVRRCALET